ncbi:MAG: ABC transporter permease [Paracoccaceae bacterium]
MKRGRLALALLLAPGLLWLMAFVLVPLGFLVVMSFWTSSIFGTVPDFSFANYQRFLDTPLYAELLLKTLRIGIVTTVISAVISYPIAYFITRQRGWRKFALVVLLFLPFWTSYVVRTFVWLPILGRNGAINQALLGLGVIDEPLEWLLYNEGIVYLGLVYVYTLFMTLPIYLSLEKVDPRLIEAAMDLGARPADIFLRILLPLTWPGILSGGIMVFLLTVSAYVTPQLLGGPSGIMFGNLIAAQYLTGNNWAFGAALSVVLAGVVLLLLLVTGRWVGIQQVFSGGRS